MANNKNLYFYIIETDDIHCGFVFNYCTESSLKILDSHKPKQRYTSRIYYCKTLINYVFRIMGKAYEKYKEPYYYIGNVNDAMLRLKIIHDYFNTNSCSSCVKDKYCCHTKYMWGDKSRCIEISKVGKKYKINNRYSNYFTFAQNGLLALKHDY